MERVVVSFRHRDGGAVRDLEVPAEVPAGELAPLLARVVAVQSQVESAETPRLEVAALGRLLEAHESLSDVGAWDGADLILHLVVPPLAGIRSKPTGGARSMPKKQGLPWKRLDD